jgi:hypothetical protein
VGVRRRPPAILSLAWILSLCLAAACGRTERASADAVRAVRSRLETRFQPPADGRLSDAQIDMYLRVLRASPTSVSEAAAAREVGASPAEFDWVRARIVEALLVLDSRRATSTVLESYGRAIATLREARRGAVEAAAARRIEGEIAALERERAALRRPDPLVSVVAANAARVQRRRSQIEAAGP